MREELVSTAVGYASSSPGQGSQHHFHQGLMNWMIKKEVDGHQDLVSVEVHHFPEVLAVKPYPPEAVHEIRGASLIQ